MVKAWLLSSSLAKVLMLTKFSVSIRFSSSSSLFRRCIGLSLFEIANEQFPDIASIITEKMVTVCFRDISVEILPIFYWYNSKKVFFYYSSEIYRHYFSGRKPLGLICFSIKRRKRHYFTIYNSFCGYFWQTHLPLYTGKISGNILTWECCKNGRDKKIQRWPHVNDPAGNFSHSCSKMFPRVLITCSFRRYLIWEKFTSCLVGNWPGVSVIEILL